MQQAFLYNNNSIYFKLPRYDDTRYVASVLNFFFWKKGISLFGHSLTSSYLFLEYPEIIQIALGHLGKKVIQFLSKFI